VAAWWDDQKIALAESTASSALARIRCVRNDTVDDGGRWSGRRYWSSDGVHPSDEGYQVWGEHIGSSILRQALLGPAKLVPSAVLARE